MEDKEYETHVRSNESIRDSMDGVMSEPNKQMSREEASKCANCTKNECTSNTNSMEFSRG
jgi:hypothetical protein